MAYTCPTCSGTGKVGLYRCPTCLGNKTLVESSHRTSVAWRGVNLGKLTGIQYSSPTISVEDISGLNSPLWSYTNGASAVTHKGIVRQLIAGDITPGTLDVEWIGIESVADNFVGCTGPLVIVHITGTTLQKTWNAMLLRFDTTRAVGELFRGSASFQLLEV